MYSFVNESATPRDYTNTAIQRSQRAADEMRRAKTACKYGTLLATKTPKTNFVVKFEVVKAKKTSRAQPDVQVPKVSYPRPTSVMESGKVM